MNKLQRRISRRAKNLINQTLCAYNYNQCKIIVSDNIYKNDDNWNDYVNNVVIPESDKISMEIFKQYIKLKGILNET